MLRFQAQLYILAFLQHAADMSAWIEHLSAKLQEVAAAFCKKNGLPDCVVQPLTEHICENYQAAQQEHSQVPTPFACQSLQCTGIATAHPPWMSLHAFVQIPTSAYQVKVFAISNPSSCVYLAGKHLPKQQVSSNLSLRCPGWSCQWGPATARAAQQGQPETLGSAFLSVRQRAGRHKGRAAVQREVCAQ